MWESKVLMRLHSFETVPKADLRAGFMFSLVSGDPSSIRSADDVRDISGSINCILKLMPDSGLNLRVL